MCSSSFQWLCSRLCNVVAVGIGDLIVTHLYLGFEKFIEVKQEKYDTSCSFRKKYAM